MCIRTDGDLTEAGEGTPRSLLDQGILQGPFVEPSSGRTFVDSANIRKAMRAHAPAPPRAADLKGKRVAVVGLGVSGKAAAKLALDRGAHVVGVDAKPGLPRLEDDAQLAKFGRERTSTVLGEGAFSVLEECELLVLSPGVPCNNQQVQQAAKNGATVVSELGFAAECIPAQTRVAAITGTNGKSTVTTFTGQLLGSTGASNFCGGNLGRPLSEASVALRRNPKEYAALVVEVSSYMMELPGSFHADVATILNLTPDHLERHGTMETYGSLKCRLLTPMTEEDTILLPQDPFLERLALQAGGKAKRAFLDSIPGVLVDIEMKQASVCLPSTSDCSTYNLGPLMAVGKHNLMNAGVALFLAEALDLGIAPAALQSAVAHLQAPPHRMMVVGEQNGVLWIDDSKSTNVDSSCAGIGGLAQPAVVLLGGLGKSSPEGLGFAKLVPLLQQHRGVVVFGKSGAEIEEELVASGMACTRVGKMAEAVELAQELAMPGDAILLSPACASFDEFDSFIHRGRYFAELFQKYAP